MQEVSWLIEIGLTGLKPMITSATDPLATGSTTGVSASVARPLQSVSSALHAVVSGNRRQALSPMMPPGLTSFMRDLILAVQFGEITASKIQAGSSFAARHELASISLLF
jgi:hypothetical protein